MVGVVEAAVASYLKDCVVGLFKLPAHFGQADVQDVFVRDDYLQAWVFGDYRLGKHKEKIEKLRNVVQYRQQLSQGLRLA